MRDPERIDAFCEELKILWKENVPDWRFGQLMMNMFSEYVKETGRDPFFPEDDEILDFMRKYIGKC